jgi:hypothetical protein
LQRLSQGGLDAIKSWITSVKDPRLVVIDTLAMVKAPRGKNDNAYDADYAAVQELRTFASEHHVGSSSSTTCARQTPRMPSIPCPAPSASPARPTQS